MDSLSPFALAGRQRELDRAATSRFPELLERKRQKLLGSPHAFLRGSAPLFYEVLAARPDLAVGPAGEGWIAGDMHLENVGAYQTDQGDVVFNLNDFDDATVGPLFLDVLRLATSVLLAGRTFQSTGGEAIALCEKLLSAYCAARELALPPVLPPAITAIVARAAARSRKELLDGRAPIGKDGKRRFVRGERYLDLPGDVAAEVPLLVADYVAALGDRAPKNAASWSIEDAAQRVAGNGSLGVLRIAVLMQDKTGEERIIELKEARRSATEALFPPPPGRWSTPAERLVFAARALAGDPPRQLAPVTRGALSLAARKLFPQEDKLHLETLKVGPKLDAVVQTIGSLLGRAHARAATNAASARWSSAETAAILDHAIELAGLFEAVYLAYARERA